MNSAKNSRTSSCSMETGIPKAIKTKLVNIGSAYLQAKATAIQKTQVVSDNNKEIRAFTLGVRHFLDQTYEKCYAFF